MKFETALAKKNLRRKPVRTAALVLLAAFLAFSVLAGSVTVISLQNGLNSYESRLGADIVVVPYEAQTKGSLESILLQGIPGYFYMDSEYLEKIRGIEGVESASPQFFLASASAGCCSAAVQLIGFDPETDFSIQPWIRRSYSGNIGYGDIIVGSAITVPKNKTLTFYNMDCRVAAQLDETGTGLDNAVYANMDTVRAMLESAGSLGFKYLEGKNVSNIISSVMVKVRDGYSTEAVTDDINIHVRHVEATQAKNMISSIADGLKSVSGFIGTLTVMIWILAIVILMIAFIMISHERKKEFAVLRVIGASQSMLSRLMAAEAVIISLSGALIGAAAASLVVFPFAGLIRQSLKLPLLLPGGGSIAALFIGSIAAAVIAGTITSSVSARRIAHNETGLILRESA